MRRSLGGLLALGFGVAWWSLVPQPVAAAPPPPESIGRVVQVVRVPVVVTVPIAVEPPKPKIVVKKKRRHPVHVTTPVVMNPVVDLEPVVPVLDPPEVIAPQPEVEILTPVEDPPPPPVVNPYTLPPIRTRPS